MVISVQDGQLAGGDRGDSFLGDLSTKQDSETQ